MYSTRRKGIIYSTTCLSIPSELKEKARNHGINMTRVLVKGLEKEVRGRENRPAKISPLRESSTNNEDVLE